MSNQARVIVAWKRGAAAFEIDMKLPGIPRAGDLVAVMDDDEDKNTYTDWLRVVEVTWHPSDPIHLWCEFAETDRKVS